MDKPIRLLRDYCVESYTKDPKTPFPLDPPEEVFDAVLTINNGVFRPLKWYDHLTYKLAYKALMRICKKRPDIGIMVSSYAQFWLDRLLTAEDSAANA